MRSPNTYLLRLTRLARLRASAREIFNAKLKRESSDSVSDVSSHRMMAETFTGWFLLLPETTCNIHDRSPTGA
jgi:hypothetical protein